METLADPARAARDARPAPQSPAWEAGAGVAAPPPAPGEALIELLFFAYRDFVGEPDRVLGPLGLGRAHHRVLHFVDRRPGLTVAALLDLLRITKQSLARVLKDLVARGLVEARPGASDRRQRRLHATDAGRALAGELHRLQAARVARALGAAGPGAAPGAERFLRALVDEAQGGEEAPGQAVSLPGAARG